MSDKERASRSMSWVVLLTAIACIWAMQWHAAYGQEGQFGQGHADMHEFYKDLAQPGSLAGSCCSDRDCRATQWRLRGAFVEAKLNGKWCKMPADKILPVSAPDGQAHVCTSETMQGADPCTATVFCVVIGNGS